MKWSLCYALLIQTVFNIIMAFYQTAKIDDEMKQRIETVAETCSRTAGTSGQPFVSCVHSDIWGSQEAPRGHAYHEVLRNFSCSVDDAGSAPVRQSYVSVDVAVNACLVSPKKGDTVNIHPEIEYRGAGFLAAGGDLFTKKDLSARQAAKLCASHSDCTGFSFKGAELDLDTPVTIFFKSDSDKRFNKKAGWHTFRKQTSESCPSSSPEYEEFTVDIFRETPLVALIRNFSKPGECEALVEAGGDWDKMNMAFTKGGKHSPYRRSYSKNIYPDLRDAANPVTRFSAKMFALTRNMTGYAVYPPGQEPINAVLYKVAGDEYRPHCDGTCNSAGYWPGERVATTILYCHMADAGGQTTFTSDALKLNPRAGDLLLFNYLLDSGNMAGVEVEHSGCPIRKGSKWVATQWYRERVHTGWNWEAANKAKRQERG